MDWLPDLILLEDHAGSWDSYIEVVYGAYCSDWVYGAPATYRGQVIRCKQNPSYTGKEYAFWHLTSVDEDGDRIPDIRRCERIRWVRSLVERVDSEDVRVWRSRRHHEERHLVALSDFSYVVVLGRRSGYFLLVTAYFVEYGHRRRKLEKEYLAGREKN